VSACKQLMPAPKTLPKVSIQHWDESIIRGDIEVNHGHVTMNTLGVVPPASPLTARAI